MTMKPFDYEAAKNGAPVQTRDGRPARIICWDKKDSHYPIVALYSEDSEERVAIYATDGKYGLGRTTPIDLVMATVKKEGWINIYPDYTAGVYDTREEADEYKGENCVACVHVEWKE